MRRWVGFAAVGLVVAMTAASWRGLSDFEFPAALAAPAESTQGDPIQQGKAERLLALLDAGDYTTALPMFDASARKALGGGALRQVWESLPKQLGPRSALIGPRHEFLGTIPTFIFRMEFSAMALDARVSFDKAGLINGFRVVPAAAKAASQPAPDATFAERGVLIAGLNGTLTLPKGEKRFAAIVLVHGSGPHDRDESIGPNKPFADLAHGLAERGIAVLRYEKRTFARPQEFSGGGFTVNDETVDDAVAAIELLRTDRQIDASRIFVAGHSLGAMMAPRIAQRAPQVAGLILLAAPARDLLDVVPQQVRYLAQLDGEVTDEERAAMGQIDAQVASTRALADGTTAAGGLLLGLPATYWLDLRGYDPVSISASLPQPILVLQGERDYQVNMDGDFRRWREAFADSKRVTLRSFANLNHLFMAGAGNPDPAEYFKAGHIDSAVLDAIAQWLQTLPATPRPAAGNASEPGFPWLPALLQPMDIASNCESAPVAPMRAARDALALDFGRRQRRCSTI